jgi:hypothetical protein
MIGQQRDAQQPALRRRDKRTRRWRNMIGRQRQRKRQVDERAEQQDRAADATQHTTTSWHNERTEDKRAAHNDRATKVTHNSQLAQ